MTTVIPLHAWADRLESMCDSQLGPLHTVRVLAEVETTQDLARLSGVGTLVTTGRQTAGRGQRGNKWADTGDEGLAFSVCLPSTTRPEQSLLLAKALVGALEPLLPGRIEVKPPNDLLLDGLKLAGVLVEQSRGLAVIGIGINVGQQAWPEELQGQAISLAEAGIQLDRLEVLERVLPAVVEAWSAD
ncbi:MAG: biotin--[acetyl-CoA-carboxylase] ligase [Phycisphaerae bacterium]|nr:biotin--[acetyl-CoA-carboxylase] ligase [Phycisphaerae bacterium]MDG1899791.1 biotin--[acetyl-CoA-carboxylase] ligase [Phycisphaerales bacterium]|tara:strand:+ start:2354 stop:2914 length:561 start_codon:yes stop_codon:yes gene_type:complete